MEMVKCEYCKKEYQKSLMRTSPMFPKLGYVCSTCQKVCQKNSGCGTSFCQNKNPHEH